MYNHNNGQRQNGKGNNGSRNNGGQKFHSQQAPAAAQIKWPTVPKATVPRENLNWDNKKPNQQVNAQKMAPAFTKAAALNYGDTERMQTQARVYMPMLTSAVMKMVSVLAIRHREGDITILDVFAPTKKVESWGKPAAMAEPIALTGQHLRGGDRYIIVGVYTLPSGVAFQTFGFAREDGHMIRLDDRPTNVFPDIRKASQGHLQLLSEATKLPGRSEGLVFSLNTQIRWKEYSSISNERELTEYNKREAELFKQAMEEFGDVAPGTPLEVARQLVAARLSSASDEVVDTKSPMFGFDADVVQIESADVHDFSATPVVEKVSA